MGGDFGVFDVSFALLILERSRYCPNLACANSRLVASPYIDPCSDIRVQYVQVDILGRLVSVTSGGAKHDIASSAYVQYAGVATQMHMRLQG